MQRLTVYNFGSLEQGRGESYIKFGVFLKKKGAAMQIQEAFLPTLKINSLSSGTHPAKHGQSSSCPDDMKSPNGTSSRVTVLMPHRSVTATTPCPWKYPASSGLFCNGARCGRQSFPGRTLRRRDRQERWQRARDMLKPAAPLTALTVSDEGAGEESPWQGDCFETG